MYNFSYNSLNPISEIPNIFFDVNDRIFENQKKSLNDLEKVEIIARWMIKNIQRGRGLGIASDQAIKIMTTQKGGVCSDFAQVFNNLCVINNIKVKEWGFKNISKAKGISGGHSFNEFFSEEMQKWIIIDTYKCVFFYVKDNPNPLSLFDLFDSLKDKKEVYFKNIDPHYSTDPVRVKDVYFSSNSIPFLIENYHNKTYDYFLKKLHFLPIFFRHGIIYLLGKSYYFLFTSEISFEKK